MRTASFFSFTGPGRICIARWAPRNTPAGYKMFKRLAPGPWFNKVSHEDYLVLFQREILDVLDPQKTWDELHALAGGAEVVLLCWESPEGLASGKTFCHRRQVADWFERTLGIEVPEMGAEEIRQVRAAQSDTPLLLVCEQCHTPLINMGTGPFCPVCHPVAQVQKA